jgi:tetratricopeptide (TPR) repeat protein
MKPRARRLVAALAAAWGALACMGPPPGPPADGAAAWIASVARRNAEADGLIDRGDPAGARRVLASLLDAAPGLERRGDGDAQQDIRRVLLQDTYFRLARLELDARAPTAAAGHAGQGLALGGRDDLFVANLLVVRGAAREALGETAAALADYDRALRINEILLHETLSPP